MARQRIEERIAGSIYKNIDSINNKLIELVDFNKLFSLHKRKIPEGTNHTIFFSLNSLTLCHQISSLKIRPVPKNPLGTSQSQRIAAEINAQSQYNVKNKYAAELSFYIGTKDISPHKYSSALLFYVGNTAYLPLIVPYLSTLTPLTTDDDLVVFCSLDMHTPLSENDRIEIFGSYDGYISYTFEAGETSLHLGSLNLTFDSQG
ncbi:hypothetical protein [Okeania sp. KiyG1]|uniref:hypothetical protein n=1 Tax=Okeania sp. KiyG1 TaxID=2720165 RepID=UPI001923E4B2|nr:hypothetical protein [Okeania sp. KiyG1]